MSDYTRSLCSLHKVCALINDRNPCRRGEWKQKLTKKLNKKRECEHVGVSGCMEWSLLSTSIFLMC